MTGLFDDSTGTDPRTAPLAERMRPRSFDEFVGQDALLAPGRPFREAVTRGLLHSVILWGPPGTGKTTLAHLIADAADAEFVAFSAVLSGIREIREVMEAAESRRRRTSRRTMVFIDEIHRFNKAQQDAFLPRVEAGDIVLVGATTENPSFEVNAALLSRSTVFVLTPLAPVDLRRLLERALSDEDRGLGRLQADVSPQALEAIVRLSDGDARRALNMLHLAVSAAPQPAGRPRVDVALLEATLQRKSLAYDRSGDAHYTLISALQKSIRSSDPDAAVYWLARMLEAGEDPLYIARRVVRCASEDIGNADPQALTVTVAARDAVAFLGMPEAGTALAQAVLYLATAPKSDAVYAALSAAQQAATRETAEPVPLHLRNAPTRLMADLGHGAGYQHAHDASDAVVEMSCLPESLQGRRFYTPSDRGMEREIRRRLDAWNDLKARRRAERGRDGR